MKAYDAMKAKVNAAPTDVLVTAYKLFPEPNEDETIQVTLTRNVLEAELEDRGIIRYNTHSWQYEWIA